MIQEMTQRLIEDPAEIEALDRAFALKEKILKEIRVFEDALDGTFSQKAEDSKDSTWGISIEGRIRESLGCFLGELEGLRLPEPWRTSWITSRKALEVLGRTKPD